MKRTVLILCICLTCILLLAGCTGEVTEGLDSGLLIGKWRCELYGSELLIEFTPDNRFISHIDGLENRYTVDGNCIVTYVEGDVNSEIAIEASIKGDTLIYGGVEYERVK